MMQRRPRPSVQVPARLAITAGALAAIAFGASCGEQQVTEPSTPTLAATTTGYVPTSSGCKSFQVTLGTGNTITVDSVSRYWCGGLIRGTLRPEVSGTPTFDRATGTVRIPIVLRNSDTTSVMALMRTLTLEDSTFIVTPTGIKNWGTGGPYVHFTNWESTTGYTRGGEWQFNPLRAGTIAPQFLPPKSLSTIKWLQMHVLSNVSKYQFMLWSTAPMALADTVQFRLDEGLSGNPARDTVVPSGSVIPYAYTVQAGHSLPMLLNNSTPVPLTGSIVADSSRTVFGWAQRTISITPDIQPLYNDLQGLLTASDPVSAFQAHLTRLSTLYGQVGVAEAMRREDLANAAAIDRVRDSTAMRRINAALKGHKFIVLPRTSDVAPLRTSGVSASRATNTNASVVPGVSTDSAEPTTYLYVNGVYTKYDDNLTMADLTTVIQQVQELNTSRMQVVWVYNATSDEVPAQTPAQIAAKCVFIASTYVTNSPAWNAAYFNCRAELSRPQDVDWIEAIQQFIAVQVNATAPLADAINLADTINFYHKAGENIILVPHSQGNMMVQQSVKALLANRSYLPATDSACIAALALASPSSDNWPFDAFHLKQVSVEGDQIAAMNHWPKTTTPLTTTAQSIVGGPLTRVFNIDRWIYWYVIALHSIRGSYLDQSITRSIVQGSLDTLYRECTVGKVIAHMPIEANWIPAGGYLPATTEVDNRNGRVLHGRKLQWWSLNPAVATVDTNGSWYGVSPGTTKIIGRSWQDTAAVTVTASRHVIGLGGHWVGSWSDGNNQSGNADLVLSPAGNSGTLTYSARGRTYISGVSGTATQDTLSGSANLTFTTLEDSAYVHFPCNNQPCITNMTLQAGIFYASWNLLAGSSFDGVNYTRNWNMNRVP